MDAQYTVGVLSSLRGQALFARGHVFDDEGYQALPGVADLVVDPAYLVAIGASARPPSVRSPQSTPCALNAAKSLPISSLAMQKSDQAAAPLVQQRPTRDAPGCLHRS